MNQPEKELTNAERLPCADMQVFIEAMLIKHGPAVIIKATGLPEQGQVIEGNAEPFTFAGDKPTLKEMQTAVGGLIEIVRIPLGPEFIMIVDEEGLLKDKPINLIACSQYPNGVTPIVGDAIIIRSDLVD